jgi:hypothetical protein
MINVVAPNEQRAECRICGKIVLAHYGYQGHEAGVWGVRHRSCQVIDSEHPTVRDKAARLRNEEQVNTAQSPRKPMPLRETGDPRTVSTSSRSPHVVAKDRRRDRVTFAPRKTQHLHLKRQPINLRWLAWLAGGWLLLWYLQPRDDTPARFYDNPAVEVPLWQYQEPTAICKDGSLSYSRTRTGTCSWHDGVARWLTYDLAP